MQNTCFDCGKQISKYAKRCVLCCNKNNIGRKYSIETKAKMSRNQKGNSNSNWRGGLPKCNVCGKLQTVHHSPRCRRCSIKDPLVIAKFKKMQMGKNNMNWKGGITELTHIIRNLPEYYIWRNEVFARDEYKCVDCGNKGYLEAHHIVAFTKLFKGFVNIYKQFSVVDDKDTLARLAISYKPFWDIANGKTLCKFCHEVYRIEARRDTHKTSKDFSVVAQTPSKEICKNVLPDPQG